MSDVKVTFTLSESLVKEASAFGFLSDEHIEKLLRTEIQTQLMTMANDPDIQRELHNIEEEFRVTDEDGLPQV